MKQAELSLVEVIAKDWLHVSLRILSPRADLPRTMLHPWLATAALGRGSSAGVFTVFSSDYYTAAKEGSVVTCICDTYGGWCAIADRVFEPYTGRYTWEVELVAVGAQKSGLFIAGACIFLLRGFWLCGVQQEVGRSCERSCNNLFFVVVLYCML